MADTAPLSAEGGGEDESGFDYDVLVIGSGFGGSVTALRLTEKGYRVGVLEAGRRFADDDLPKNSWHLRDFLWAPRARLHRHPAHPPAQGRADPGRRRRRRRLAQLRQHPLRAAAAVLRRPAVGAHHRLGDELAPHYDQAKRMLGVVDQPAATPPRREMQRRSPSEFGVGDTFHPTPVGVFFGRDGAREPGDQVADPFFGGAGPDRTGCIDCGECMTGCRHDAKNTLVKNYLVPGRAGRRRGPPADHGHRRRPLRRRRLRASTCAHRAAGATQAGAADVHRRAGRLLRRHLQHAEAAARDAGHGHAAARSPPRSAYLTPHQLRGAARRCA